MYLKIGGVLRMFNEATASVSYKPVYDNNRRMTYVDEGWAIAGRVVLQTNASQRNMTIAIDKLKRDFSQVRPDLIFIEDDGYTPSTFKLLARECLQGPDITDLTFPTSTEDIYPTGVNYTANYEARKSALGSGANPIIEFQETLSNPSGGEVRQMVGGAINLAEMQITKQNDPYLYTQSGRAVGLYGYPSPPPPLWPSALLRRNRPVLVGPRVLGPRPMEFEITWEYLFGSPFPLIGVPHILL